MDDSGGVVWLFLLTWQQRRCRPPSNPPPSNTSVYFRENQQTHISSMDSLPNQLGYLLLDEDGAVVAVCRRHCRHSASLFSYGPHFFPPHSLMAIWKTTSASEGLS